MGLDHGVLYAAGVGVPWNGLVSVVESASEAPTKLYFDGQPYFIFGVDEEFAATLSALTYPDEFDSVQESYFGLSYRVGTEIHLVYNARVQPAEETHSQDMTTFQWPIVAKPVDTNKSQPTAHYVIETANIVPAALTQIEDLLYGTPSTAPSLPTAQAILDICLAYALFVVTDNGDGTATVSGPDTAVFMVDSKTARLSWPSVIQISEDTYQISTY